MACVHQVGTVSIIKVVEQCGPGFKPDYLYPDWDPAVMEQHRALMIPDCFDEAQGRFIASIHTWVVRTRHRAVQRCDTASILSSFPMPARPAR